MIPYILAAIGGYLIGDSLKSQQYAKGGKVPEKVRKFIDLQNEINKQIDTRGEADLWLTEELAALGDSLNSYESELAIEEYMKQRSPVTMSNGGELESDRKKALEWWSSLSINEQKEYSRKHLSPYYYSLIWDYSLSKHISYKKYYDLRVEVWKKETQNGGTTYAKGGGVEKRFVEMKDDKPIYALKDAIYHFSLGYLNDKGYPVTSGTAKVYRKGSGLKKIKQYKENTEYSIQDEKTDDKGIYHITFVGKDISIIDGEEKKFVVSFDRDDLYANGGVMNDGDKELKHYQELENKSISVQDVNENLFGALSSSAIQTIQGKRLYAIERMKELGLADESYDFLFAELKKVKESFDILKEEQKQLIKGFLIKRKNNFKNVSTQEYLEIVKKLVATKNLKHTADEVYRMEKSLPEYANGGQVDKGGTIEEQLEKINIYNDLDAYEYDQYKKFTDNGMSKVDSLKVIINMVEGDTSQLSKKLASIAKKIKY